MITIWNSRKDFEKYKLGSKYSVSDLVYPVYILYVPCLIYLYSYLFKQRSKVLNKLIPEKTIKRD